MYFPCFCILEMKHMTLLQRDKENIELPCVQSRFSYLVWTAGQYSTPYGRKSILAQYFQTTI